MIHTHTHTITVLVVEDEPTLQDIYATALTRAGFEVLLAEDGVAGLKMAIEHVPSIILLDIMLPQKCGYDVLRELRDNGTTKSIPVIMLTNLGQVYEKKRGIDLGANDYLVKSDVTPEQVVQKVRQYTTM